MRVARRIFTLVVWLVCIGLVAFLGLRLYETVRREWIFPIKYEAYVERYAEENGLPEALVYAVIKTESDFDPSAKSGAGAVGLMQLLPSTYEWLTGLTGDEYAPDTLSSPETAIRYGCLYLAQMQARFGGLTETLAAYNAGPGTVSGWLSDSQYARDGKLVDIPYAETRAYVERVQETAREYQNLYGEEKEWNDYE